MMLTEECAQAQIPRSPAERQKFIAAQEKAWMSLSWDRKRYTSDQAKTAITLLSAIGFSDYRDPIDLSHLSDEAPSSSLDGRSSGDGAASLQPGSPSTTSQKHAAHAPTSSAEPRRRLTGTKRPASYCNQHMNNSSNTNGVALSTSNSNNNNHDQTNNNSNNNNNNNNNKPPKKPRCRKPAPSVNGNASIAHGTQVACCDKSSPDTCDMWVLGRVDKYIPEIRKYEVLDHDGGEQRYRVTRQDLRVIAKRQNFDMTKPILAVYPSTTVFYKARLVGRRGKNNWAVEFDDEDDYDSDKVKEIDGRLILQDVSLS